MPWDWRDTHSDFFAHIDGFENPLALEVAVDPALNGGANVLCTYTGTVLLGKLFALPYDGNVVERHSGVWVRGGAEFNPPTPGRRWTFIPLPPEGIPDNSPMTYFHGGTVALSLASIWNKNVANNAGWAVDGANVVALGNEVEGLRVEAKVAVNDTDGYLYRLAYQVTALGQGPRTRVGPIIKG